MDPSIACSLNNKMTAWKIIQTGNSNEVVFTAKGFLKGITQYGQKLTTLAFPDEKDK